LVRKKFEKKKKEGRNLKKKKKKALFRSILEQMFQITTTAVKKIADKNAAETGVCGQKLQASS